MKEEIVGVLERAAKRVQDHGTQKAYAKDTNGNDEYPELVQPMFAKAVALAKEMK